uniref:Uncharacterized protein n=1 Tax=Lepeophtheirus salmonis TaxID=72036 RepID=A0A0K2UIA0_LEPSM
MKDRKGIFLNHGWVDKLYKTENLSVQLIPLLWMYGCNPLDST